MNKYLAILLIFSLLLNITGGCYSFQQIYYDENTNIIDIESNDVRVTLTNGKIIRSDAYHHSLIFSNSEFIVGEVSKYLQGDNYRESFYGRIMKSDIDSSFLDPQNEDFTVWLKSRKTITFPAGHYFIATNETENGFWHWDKNQTNKIDLKDISMIEADKFNIVTTSLLVAGGIILIGFVILAITFDFDGSLIGGKESW